jgi:putative serine/threonine protein kinase
MFHEAEMLKKANSANVGAKFVKVSPNFLIMELIAGKYFPEWTKSLEENDLPLLIKTLENILIQCHRLDVAGLDHGELSNASKHIIIDEKNIPYLIDFETASIKRRVSNVSSICQFFFLGSQIAPLVKEKMEKKINDKQLVEILRMYKKSLASSDFKKILEQIFNYH